MNIYRHPWAAKHPGAVVPVRDAVFASLIDDDHDACPGRTAENNARAISIIAEALVAQGSLGVEEIAVVLEGKFRIE